MAFQATSMARPLLPSSPPSTSHTPSSLSKPTSLSKPQFAPISLSLTTSTSLSLFALFTVPNNSNANTVNLPKEEIVSTLTEIEKKIDQAQEVGSGVLEFSKRAYQSVIDTLKPGVDAVLPIFKKAGDQAVLEASKKVQEVIQSSGIDTEPIAGAAKTVAGAAQQTTQIIEAVKPIASSTLEAITAAGPIVIAETAGVLVLTYLLLPPIWSVISFGLRGYKGKLTPAQSLDLLCTRNHLLIDIRSEKDKNKAGIPRLPSSAKSKLIPIPLEELSGKLRGLVRNVKKTEAEIVALKISYLKRATKGSNIIIMDSNSDAAKIVAKKLTSLGFKCWIMAGGFSGNKGWLQSQLGTDSYNVSLAEVVSPSRIFPAAVRRFSTISSTAVQSDQKFLPGRSNN